MKVVTYNIHGWLMPEGASNLAPVAEILAESGADIIGLNEVFHPLADGAAPLEQLARRLGMHYAFGATQSSDPARHPPYGNALLSRWPILAHAAHHLAPVTSYGKRGMLEVRVLLPAGTPFTLYVTHLDHRLEALRLEQWAAAHTWLLRDRERPHLVLGDFNALALVDYEAPQDRERLAAYQAAQGWPVAAFDVLAQVARAGYVDAQAQTGGIPASTFPAREPERRIDYIFVPDCCRAALRVCRPLLTRDTQAASDHLPVVAELDWGAG